MVSVWGAALLARESEQAAIERLLADQSPAAVFLEGEPGIGKSTVWGAGVATAMQHGYLTLTARGSEAETGLSYSGLTDLLDPVADEVLADLPAPQRDALEVVLLRRLPGEVPIAQRTVGAAVLSTLRQLTVQHRLLLAIDDLQWLDRPTVAALTFALRRLPAGTVRLLTARRLPSGLAAEQAEDVSQLVRDALPAEQTEVVLLDRLEDAAIERLLIDRMELALSDRQLRRLLERVDGNPFWALEVGASVAGRTGDAADELPVPDSLATLVTERVAALTRGAHDALLIVSALHQPTTELVLRVLAAQLSDPQGALDAAVAAGVVTEAGARLRPGHPLLGSVALDSLPPGRRASLHRRLAAVVSDPEQHARHLALAAGGQPDAEVATALDAGANAARARGAPRAAADLLELAIVHTPADHSDELARRRFEAGKLYFASGDLERACELAESVYATDPPAELRRRMFIMLVELTYWIRSADRARALIRDVLDDPRTDPHLHAIALAAASDIGDGRDTPRLELAARALREFDELTEEPDPEALATALIYQAYGQIDQGEGIAHELIARAMAAQEQLPWISLTSTGRAALAFWRKSVDDLDGSRQALDQLIVQARDEGEDGALPGLYGHLALTECWAGRYEAGQLAVVEGLRYAELGGLVPVVLHASRALLSLLTGDSETASALATSQLAAAGERTATLSAVVYRQVLGAAALLREDNAEAVELLQTALATARAAGINEPGRRQRLEGDLGQALVNTGQLDEAAELAAELQDLGERQDRPTIIGVGLRIAGLMQASRGNLDKAIALLQQAVAEHEKSPLPLERGRSLLALGQTQRRRRARPAARAALEDALACFTELGAVPFIEAASRELGRLGGARAPGALTEAERRVAELVSSGLSNRDVAARLFTSVRTVEGHLAAVYRKIGVRSRTELASRLGPTADGSGPQSD